MNNKLKFLIIEQDLRVSGTSQGIISRSFLGQLKIAYPEAIIDVFYLKNTESDDHLELLPVNSIEAHVVDVKVPFFTKWFNKFYWRVFNVSLKERYIHKQYASYIKSIEYNKYDHVFIRSSGLDCETLLAAKDLPILKKATITFNEPYPTYWCSGSTKTELTNLDLFRLKNMQEVVKQAKSCMATLFLAQDMQYLYGSHKKFYSMPHHYVKSVFNFNDKSQVFTKTKKVTIGYHGAIQFGRNIDVVLDSYVELIKTNEAFKTDTEFILRLKSNEIKRLRDKYSGINNIVILEGVNFSNSIYEQEHLIDINILLENGPIYCSVLLGKAPVIASFNKRMLIISPERSEIREILIDKDYVASYKSKVEIKEKLEWIIKNRFYNEEFINPFGDYFSHQKFKQQIHDIITQA